MRRVLNWVLIPIFLVLCFAWGNSLISGEESANISGGLYAYLVELFPVFANIPRYLFRKLAHFTEFAALGFFTAWYFVWRGRQRLDRVYIPMSLCMLAALVDETIQTRTPLRTPSVTDVWIDSAGAAVGIVLFLLGYTVVNRIKNKKR